jgi:hypothetical protein
VLGECLFSFIVFKNLSSVMNKKMSTTFGFFFLVAITIFVLTVGHSFALEQIHQRSKNPMVELVQRQPL